MWHLESKLVVPQHNHDTHSAWKSVELSPSETSGPNLTLLEVFDKFCWNFQVLPTRPNEHSNFHEISQKRVPARSLHWYQDIILPCQTSVTQVLLTPFDLSTIDSGHESRNSLSRLVEFMFWCCHKVWHLQSYSLTVLDILLDIDTELEIIPFDKAWSLSRWLLLASALNWYSNLVHIDSELHFMLLRKGTPRAYQQYWCVFPN